MTPTCGLSTPSSPVAPTTSFATNPIAGGPLPDIAAAAGDGAFRTPPDLTQNNQAFPEVNLDFMELLVRFEFEEQAPDLNVELHTFASKLLFKCAVDAPYLMHQILAISARRLADLEPARSHHFRLHAMRLQTKAVSIYNETAAKDKIDQSNCSALLLFCSLLGRHLLADLLARRDADFGDFLSRFLEFLSISRGLMAMSVAAWDLLLQSDIRHLVLWALGVSQSMPQGHHCAHLQQLVARSQDLCPSSKKACMTAIACLQVGFDSLLGGDARNQKHLMVFMWYVLILVQTATAAADHPLGLLPCPKNSPSCSPKGVPRRSPSWATGHYCFITAGACGTLPTRARICWGASRSTSDQTGSPGWRGRCLLSPLILPRSNIPCSLEREGKKESFFVNLASELTGTSASGKTSNNNLGHNLHKANTRETSKIKHDHEILHQ